MFKRKAALPARPALPDNTKILEDLENAKDSDIVFTVHPDLNSLASGNKLFSNYPDYNVTLDENEDLSDANKSYLKAKKFAEKLEYLETHVSMLEEQKQNLLKMKETLSKDMQNIQEELLKNSSNSLT